jgi:hypothetical protein
MRILMVHGMAQGGRKAEALEKLWVETLQEGFDAAGQPWPATLHVDFPYYGDTLDAFVAQARLPTPAGVVAKGPGQNLEFEKFMQSALGQMQEESADISEQDVRSQMDPSASQEKGIQNWGWVQAIARVIDNHLTPASNFTIEAFLREVFLYVSRREVTDAINALVAAKLTNEPTIVIGHSLGSVVAYNVIKAQRRATDLRRFITVGSPLGLRAISSKLGVVENIARPADWYNAYDERDIVALNPLDGKWFPVRPKIVNNNRVANTTDNRHGIVGYLNDRDVAAQVAAALG